MSRLAGWLPRKSAAQHVLHQNQAVAQSITCVRACLRECMCSHTQRRSFSFYFQTNVISFKAQLRLIGTLVQCENECACCVVDKSCVLQY